MESARFAPSTTGPPHPGTLLAALLCWLDARSRGVRALLRLEDLDPERCRPEWAEAMTDALAWLGLDWDETRLQSRDGATHAAALDALAAAGRLYPCKCSRSDLRSRGRPLAGGGFAYPGTCRDRALPSGGWRASAEPLRVGLPPEVVSVPDESGGTLSGTPAVEPGDPIVRRRDGAIAYHLAGVADDGASGVTRIVRGRDLAATTPTQVALQRLLGLPTPVYRHHFLLLEERGGKLAKLHGAVGIDALREVYTAEALCGVLAFAAGLRPSPEPTIPGELLTEFDWSQVREDDCTLRWTGDDLVVVEATRATASS